MENYLAEVCPLSRGMMLQSLSPPLQRGIRFLRVHLPAGRSGLVANPLPLPCGRSETYRFTEFIINNFVRFRTRLSTGGAFVRVAFAKTRPACPPAILARLVSIREPILCHDGSYSDYFTLSMSVSLTATRSDALRFAMFLPCKRPKVERSRCSAPCRCQQRTFR